jgi:hypothetical protein
MSGTTWLLSSLPLKSGILLFSPDLKGDYYDPGILWAFGLDSVYKRVYMFRLMYKFKVVYSFEVVYRYNKAQLA